MKPFSLAIHGGAGTILRSRMTPEKEAIYKAGLSEALTAGHRILAANGSALEAVTTAVVLLENNPLFNAGKGAVYAGDGTHLLDAAIMEGHHPMAGAIAGVRGIKNPILLARKVMEDSAYVMMIGQGAEEFARLKGLDFAPQTYFHDALRYEQWLRVKDTPITQLDHADKGEKNFSTVGAVALDQQGHLAAASSTGGMTNKRFGRVGDTPLIGAGTYANRLCAVACTGHGEPFIKAVVGHDIAARMQYKGLSLAEATDEVVHQKLVDMKGLGGLISVDAKGRVAMPFNCEGMYRAAQIGMQEAEVEIFR
ncbi:MAG: isoaspartyl peptidase/L-asparaginase [Bacteroidota bacterium]